MSEHETAVETGNLPPNAYPAAAAEYDGDDACAYEECENEADYIVEFGGASDSDGNPVTTKICQPCSNRNKIYAKENDLLENELTSDVHGVEADIGFSRFRSMGVTNQPAQKLADEFDSEDGLIEYLTDGHSLTDISGVGEKSANLVREWYKREYPEKERERKENDEAYCTEYTTDHGLSDDELEEIDVVVWAWLCPRCSEKNPMKGDPDEFGNRPFECVNCSWVPLLDRESLMEFADENLDQ